MPAAHAVHADAPDTSLNLPAGHGVQDALPAAELKFPGAQDMHAEGEEEPWFGL